MRFALIDRVLDVGMDDAGMPARAIAIKHVTAAEEYLADHFPGFPILPGVFMLEALVQTARHVADARDRTGPAQTPPVPWVLGAARAVKYGAMVPPGSTLRVEVELVGEKDGTLEFKGVARLIDPSRNEQALGDGASGNEEEGRTAVSGRFALRRAAIG